MKSIKVIDVGCWSKDFGAPYDTSVLEKRIENALLDYPDYNLKGTTMDNIFHTYLILQER